jgi:hypothetical protein
MLCRFLLHAVNLRHGTDGFTSPPKEVRATDFITHKNPPSSAGPEPAAASPMGPMAGTTEGGTKCHTHTIKTQAIVFFILKKLKKVS